jgi:adenine-specific DNA-methyltransferase
MEAALREMKRRQRFGLVFEEHIPETTALYGLPIQTGSLVQRRDDPQAKVLYRVTATTPQGQATVEPSGGGEPEQVPVGDLLAVKRFGEPMYPALTPLGSVRRGGDGKPHHAVINGENFHALQLLVYQFEGQVDCIYIDPPYNTGARDWKYNNRYVDKNDAWRHSKWLSMMEKRLRSAKRLLKPDGVLIVTIDEHELHHLGMLLERLFPEYHRYMVNIVINPKGRNEANFGRVEEQAFFVVPNLDHEIIAQLPPPDDQKEAELAVEVEDRTGDEEGVWVRDLSESGEVQLPAGLRERLGLDGNPVQVELTLGEDGGVKLYPLLDEEADEEDEGADEEVAAADDDLSVLFLRRRGAESSFRYQRPNQFYAIKVNETTREVVGVGPFLEEDDDYELGYREGDVLWVYPIDEEGNERVWRYVRETMQQYIDAGQIRVGKRWKSKPQTYTLNHYKPREGERVQRLRTTWWRTAHDAGTHGTTLLSRLLGTQSPFPFPKSLYAVRDCLEAVVKHRPDALIVDYFAGSGTTLHATALLNRTDGGRRRCVLVTNNELDEKTARKLNKAGHFPGDPEFERHGIFEAATRPRIETALTGIRPDGSPVPTGKAYRYLDGRPWSEGFEENCEFYRLDYLDPDEVDLGLQFEAILPALWMAAGGVGNREKPEEGQDYSMPEGSTYGVLFKESRFRRFREALEERPDVTHVWLVTDSEEAYAEMRSALPARLSVSMLYRDYLRNFRINTERNL